MAFAAPSKKKKVGPASKTADISIDEDASSSTVKTPCVVCAGVASPNIKRDDNFNAMMQLYWCTLGIDVKPDICSKADICRKCFLKIVEYFETNDIIVYFENYFKSLRMELLRRTLKGMSEWEKGGLPFTKMHTDIKAKYGDIKEIHEPEEDQIKNTLSAYKMETYSVIDDSEDEEDGGKKGSGTRREIKLSRVNNDKQKPGSKISLKQKRTENASISDSE